MYLFAASLPQLLGCLSRIKFRAWLPKWITTLWSSILSFKSQSNHKLGLQTRYARKDDSPEACFTEAREIQMQISRLSNPMITVFVNELNAEITNPRYSVKAEGP